MKTFFFLLLLTNIVFGMLQWLMPYEQVFSRTQPMIAAEQLRLLGEVENPVSPVSDAQQSQAEPPPVSVPSASKRLCYTLGPFKDEAFAQQVIDRFNQEQLAVTSRPSQEKEYMGMMVYIDGHTSREDAVTTAEDLAERGVRDYMIVNEEGKSNALSLGVFGLKKNADRRLQHISAYGYEVKSEPRYRNRTIYWLDYDKPESGALAEVVDRLKVQQGLSRISRACG